MYIAKQFTLAIVTYDRNELTLNAISGLSILRSVVNRNT